MITSFSEHTLLKLLLYTFNCIYSTAFRWQQRARGVLLFLSWFSHRSWSQSADFTSWSVKQIDATVVQTVGLIHVPHQMKPLLWWHMWQWLSKVHALDQLLLFLFLRRHWGIFGFSSSDENHVEALLIMILFTKHYYQRISKNFLSLILCEEFLSSQPFILYFHSSRTIKMFENIWYSEARSWCSFQRLLATELES